ncbi:MAG: glutathione S-transferase family protein [Myxococcota bacterium]
MNPPIRLYSYAMSPYAAKVHGFLLHKQLDFEVYYIHPLRVREELPVGRQIPVLRIGDESRADSTPIGLWLDERFPERPLLPADPAERAHLLEIDDWVSQRLIPCSFRSYPGPGLDRWRNGWKLSRVMTKTARGGLNPLLRFLWPAFVTRVPFVKRLVAQADDGRPVRESKLGLYREFIDRLKGGPYLCGRSEPSLPDFACYPQFALYYEVGFRGSEDVLDHPPIMEWLGRMKARLSATPELVPARVRVRELPTGPTG